MKTYEGTDGVKKQEKGKSMEDKLGLNAINEAVKHCNEALLSLSKNFKAIARQVHEIRESLVESRKDKQVEQEAEKE